MMRAERAVPRSEPSFSAIKRSSYSSKFDLRRLNLSEQGFAKTRFADEGEDCDGKKRCRVRADAYARPHKKGVAKSKDREYSRLSIY